MKIFPIHGVNAIGRKLFGLVASVVADDLPMSLIAAHFHNWGTVDCNQQALKRSVRASSNARHFLKMK